MGNRHPKAAYFTRGTGHDEYANYSEDPEDWHALLNRLKKKFETLKPFLPQPVAEKMEGARINLVSFGSTEPAIQEARALLQREGIASDFTRIRSYPFNDVVKEICSTYERNYIVEMNRDGQLHQLLRMHYPELSAKMISYAYTDGLPLTAKQIFDFIFSMEKQNERTSISNGC
jgi:2-oxoglutarate ferredoxin oxidoreductase subunit alpha